MISPYSPEIPKESLLPLKGQLHCHWYDDGQLPDLLKLGDWAFPGSDLSKKPGEVARLYHRLGYDFLAFTEHNDKKVLDYLEENPKFGIPGTCLVAATPEVGTQPTFIEILRSEEVTAEHHHVLGFGVRNEVTEAACQGDPPFARLAEEVKRGDPPAGVAFLPHPRQYLGNAAYTDFHKQITLQGSTQTRFSAIAVRTAASALLWKDSLCLWDVLLNQEICTQTADQRTILLPAYSEDDYAPLGLGRVEILTPGSTWIEVEIDKRSNPWPETGDDANGQRSDTLLIALQSGRWWTYWVEGCRQWPKGRRYPRLTLSVDEGQQTLTVTSDRKLTSLSFITRLGMTHPDKRKNVPAGKPEPYQCQGDEVYVRVAAEYESSGYTLRVYGNPVWVRRPAAPEVERVAPPPTAAPTVALAPDLPVLEGETTIRLQVEGEVIHAPVRIDKRIVAYAKPIMGTETEWQAKVDVSSYPSGSYTLQVEVVDRQGRSDIAEKEVEVRSDMAASAIDIDQGSLPTTLQTGFARLTGPIAPVHKGARPAGVVVRVDGRDAQIYKANIKGERWSCMVPRQVFTRGTHTVEVSALYARTPAQKAEAKWDIS